MGKKIKKKQEKTRMKNDSLKPEDSRHPETKYPPEFYEIVVQGQLDGLWGQWFEAMTLSNVRNGERDTGCTLISGQVADQAVLHGLLLKIRDLNLKLISVRLVSPKKDKSE